MVGNLLALAVVKVPWMVGRRCLGLGKEKGRRRLERKRKCRRSEIDCVVERDGNVRNIWVGRKKKEKKVVDMLLPRRGVKKWE
jgi:hypothetical protein